MLLFADALLCREGGSTEGGSRGGSSTEGGSREHTTYSSDQNQSQAALLRFPIRVFAF